MAFTVIFVNTRENIGTLNLHQPGVILPSPPTLRDIWQYLEMFFIVTLWRGLPLTSGGWRPHMLLNILESTGPFLPEQDGLAQNTNSAEDEKS